MTCVELISLIANLCTIAAFGVALHVWLTWKKQHNYSFVRDKVFESEIVVIDTYTSLVCTIQVYIECKRIYLVNNLIGDPQFLREDFKKSEALLYREFYRYKAAQTKLNSLKIKYDPDILIDYECLHLKWGDYKTQIHAVDNEHDLGLILKIILKELDILAEKARQHLSCIRYEI